LSAQQKIVNASILYILFSKVQNIWALILSAVLHVILFIGVKEFYKKFYTRFGLEERV